MPAIEEAIFAGIPVNVTLLFSREQYLAAAEAFLRGVERRHRGGPESECGIGGIDLCEPLGRRGRSQSARTSAQPARYRHRHAYLSSAYRDVLNSQRWQRIYNAGARPQRLLWASTGTKDPKASDILYVKALAAPFTVNTMPEATLKALAGSHRCWDRFFRPTVGIPKKYWRSLRKPESISTPLASQFQDEGAKSFVKSWDELMGVIASKSAAIQKSARE